MKQVGEKVILNGKIYEITGYHKRSYLLKGENGKMYKATPDKIERMTGVGQQVASGVPAYLEQMVAMSKIFNKDAKFPETEAEIMDYFRRLSSELSPENLTCDGELSTREVARKRNGILQSWKYLEGKLGRKVTEEETYK